MDVEILARVQFALTIMFHYIYPPLSIGLSVVMVLTEALYLKTKELRYLLAAKFWTKIFAVTFALGVGTGIVMEFEFGTNWATYSRYVGDVFGSALAAEGVFAFFLESGFLAILLFGWDRVGKKLHFFSTLMVCLGAHFSAIWIVVANSWMQTPTGFHIVGEGMQARAEIIDFWAMVFNPSSMTRLAHVITGAWLAGAFLVISISAYYILRNRHLPFAKRSLEIGLWFAFLTTLLQVWSGDKSAVIVAKHQPSKFAAFEGIYKTEKEVPFTLMGIVNAKEEKLEYQLQIPKLLSWMTFGDTSAEIKGLDAFPKKDWPNVPVLFQTYRLMIGMWVLMFGLSATALFLWYRGTLFTKRWILHACTWSVLAPQVANQAGWVAAEMGRYPWIVYNLLRISDGLSKTVIAEHVLGSMIMFTVVYLFLFIMFLYLLNEKIQHGPDEVPESTEYPQLQTFIDEVGYEHP
jgi:cytochrome d ubiquinol oxidase subunit I